jgi:hypothetical protein
MSEPRRHHGVKGAPALTVAASRWCRIGAHTSFRVRCRAIPARSNAVPAHINVALAQGGRRLAQGPAGKWRIAWRITHKDEIKIPMPQMPSPFDAAPPKF